MMNFFGHLIKSVQSFPISRQNEVNKHKIIADKRDKRSRREEAHYLEGIW